MRPWQSWPPGNRDGSWKVFYESVCGRRDTLHLERSPPRSQIESHITEGEQLAAAGHYKAAFLLAWSVLEAIARERAASEGTISRRPFSRRHRQLQSLEMAGAIDRVIGQDLRAGRQLRNLAAHGDLGAKIDADVVDRLLRLLRRLSAAANADHVVAGA